MAALVIGSLIVLFFACARKEALASAVSGGPELLSIKPDGADGSIAKTKETPVEQIPPAQENPMRNPFLTEEEEREFADAGKAIPIEHLRASAIIYTSSRKSKAIINGQVFKIGDYVDNKEIVEIQSEAVILKDAAAEYIVRLRDL